MENKKLHITSLNALLNAAQNITSEAERTLLIESLKQLNTTDDALEGAILFLEDHNWNIELLHTSTEHITTVIDRKKTKKRADSLGKIVLKYAAIFMLPLSLLFSYYYLNKPSAIEKWFIEEPGLPNYMADRGINKWEEPMQAYREGNYAKCIEQINALPIDINNDTILYFGAVSHYKMGEFDRSLVLFKKLRKMPKSVFYQDAEFRIGFTLYQLDQLRDSEASFRKIASNKNHSFNTEASLILENLFDNK